MFYFVIDVESVGLHGEGFAVGGGLYCDNGAALWEFCLSCPIDECAGTQEDRKWAKENIPLIEITHRTPKNVRDSFWSLWMKAKEEGAIMVADCPWPVEANFLRACIKDDESRKKDGPYPLIDVSSVLLSAGKNPLRVFKRTSSELPKHHPMCDARQSARIFCETLSELSS